MYVCLCSCHFMFVYTAHNWNFKKHKGLEREPLRYVKGDGEVTFTRPVPNVGQGTPLMNI